MSYVFKEEHITDYILGELDDEAKSHLEEVLISNPEAKNLYERSKEFFLTLERELGIESGPSFSDAQKNAMITRFGMASTVKGRVKMMFEKPLYHMGSRYGLVIGAAGVVTMALFFVMHSLIKMESYAPDKEIEKLQPVEIVMPPKPVASMEEEIQLPIKDIPDIPPPLDNIVSCFPTDTKVVWTTKIPEIRVTDQDFDGQLIKKPSSPESRPSDMTAVPVVRVQPMYPQEAATQRIEGWVRLRFTISRTGAVKDPEIVASSPEWVFNQAALTAIRKWKYKPKVINGSAIETPNVQVKLTFELEDV